MTVNRIKYIQLVLLLAFAFIKVNAQEYSSLELEEIGSLLKSNPIKHYSCKDPKTGAITHLGLSLFTQQYDYPYNDVLKFVERFALHAQLLNTTEQKLLLSDKKVKITPMKLEPADSLSKLEIQADGQRIYINWSHCRVSFPQEFNLIYGLNKKESDNYFRESLLKFYNSSIVNESDNKKRIPIVTPYDSTAYYVKEGVNYIIHEVNTNQFYVKSKGDTLRPLYTEKYAAESVVNIMQQIVSSDEFVLNICQNLYGYKKVNFSIPLKSFSDFCASSGCTPYVGIEEETEAYVKAVVVYRNEFFGYNHLLYVEVPRIVLKEQKGSIKAFLYCYIPTHNLKERL